MKRVALEKVAKIDRTMASDEDCQIMPYVGLEHVEKDAGHFSTSFVPNPESVLATKFRFTSKHVLYGKLRPYLNKVVMPNFDGVCTTEILPILPCEDELDRTFLWGYLLTPEFVSWASMIVSGANLPRLAPSDLAKHEIPLPPIEEQRRIAGILARADRLRQLRRYALQLSEGYLQSVFLQMFGDPVTNPMGWEIRPLGKHVTFITSGSRGWAQYYASEGDRFIRSLDVQMNHISDENAVYVDAPKTAEAARAQVKSGDVLLTITGSKIGRVAPVVAKEQKPAYVSQHVAIVRLDGEIESRFISMFLSLSEGGQRQIQQMQYGQTKPGLSLAQIKRFMIPIPPPELRQKYLCIMDYYERLRAQQHEAARQADHLFATLLHRAFTPSP